MITLNASRVINAEHTFDALVKWFHQDILINRHAPGFIIGLSGTDSLVAFCAASKALELAGMSNRMLGVHFAPSEDFLYDHPEAEVHLWFKEQVFPWINKQYPNAKIIADTSIDWRCDGLRWGALMDMSVVSDGKTRTMRAPEDQYWVVGTRNLTESILLTYSNMSSPVSLQPLIHLWKSEILELSKYLELPQVAINKSCETDCICGRQRLMAEHIKEIDMLLMERRGELSEQFIQNNIPNPLRNQLNNFIINQINNSQFKNNLPYKPEQSVVHTEDKIVLAFENGSLDIKMFGHQQHIYVAWHYLNTFSFGEAVKRYKKYLKILLTKAGKPEKFSDTITDVYFSKLDLAMSMYPNNNFDDFIKEAII